MAYDNKITENLDAIASEDKKTAPIIWTYATATGVSGAVGYLKCPPEFITASPALTKARGPWPTRRCTSRAATNLVNGSVPNREPREEVIFQILASMVESGQLCVNDFWGQISFDLEAEVRVRASLDAAASRERCSHRKVST